MRRSDSAVPSVLPRPRWGSDSTRDDRAGDGEPRRASRAPVPWFGSLRLPFSSAYVRLRDRYIGCVGSGFGRRGSAPNALGRGGRWARSLRETGVGRSRGRDREGSDAPRTHVQLQAGFDRVIEADLRRDRGARGQGRGAARSGARAASASRGAKNRASPRAVPKPGGGGRVAREARSGPARAAHRLPVPLERLLRVRDPVLGAHPRHGRRTRGAVAQPRDLACARSAPRMRPNDLLVRVISWDQINSGNLCDAFVDTPRGSLDVCANSQGVRQIRPKYFQSMWQIPAGDKIKLPEREPPFDDPRGTFSELTSAPGEDSLSARALLPRLLAPVFLFSARHPPLTSSPRAPRWRAISRGATARGLPRAATTWCARLPRAPAGFFRARDRVVRGAC